MAQTNHITIKYTASRERKIRKDYETEKQRQGKSLLALLKAVAMN